MNDASINDSRRRAEELVHRMLDYSLTDAEHAELAECLRRDVRARQLFIEQSLLHAVLREQCESSLNDSLCSRLFGVRQDELSELAPQTTELLDRNPIDKAAGDGRANAAFPAPCEPRKADGLSASESSSGWWGKHGSLGMFGAIFCAVVAAGLWLWFGGRAANEPNQATAGNRSNDDAAITAITPVALEYVARVVKATDGCVWEEESGPAEFLLRVRAGSRMKLVAGLVELEFYSGARIILHGPAVFTPTGPSSGHLESGRLTGEVSHGNYRLMTPAAEVIDLGTAFGVVADADAGTDVVVFNGKVQVVSRNETAENTETVNMTEGMAARFRFDGTTEFGLKTDAKQFARDVSPRGDGDNPNQISLIDVIAGGNGLEAHLAGAIDPMTGLRDYGDEGRKSKHYGRWTDGKFHSSSWHPLIDGVFVPFPTGRATQIDSRGGALDLPATTGTTHGSIWARRKESVQAAGDRPDNDFWGTRTLQGIVQKLKQTQVGLVGMHANVGITFDLRALKMAHRRAAAGFQTLVANIENSADWAPHERPVPEVATKIADCRVFVDGSLRASRLGFRREDGDLPLAVPLSSDDRFLTIFVTDGDEEMRFDHVVLIDPIITLAKD